ncbi:MAG TPA: hypothetical protein VF733_02565 [Candidatus Saccharimonadales bacterium]
MTFKHPYHPFEATPEQLSVTVVNSSFGDALYLRPGPGRELTTRGEGLAPNQIGYSARVLPISGTDHLAIETILTLPPKHQHGQTI